MVAGIIIGIFLTIIVEFIIFSLIVCDRADEAAEHLINDVEDKEVK